MKKYWILFVLVGAIILRTNVVWGTGKQPIIVIGSEPECITAAVTARKLGHSVTLITESNALGGLLVEGMLTALDINFDENDKVLHQGFFKAFLTACSNGYNIDFKLTQDFFNELMKTYDIHVIYNAKQLTPIVNHKSVKGIAYTLEDKVYKLYGAFILDGSTEASFSRKLGVPYKKGRSELGQTNSAAASLIFSVKNADWNKITKHLSQDQNQLTGFRKNAAWGFNQMYQYPSSSKRLQMRGLNLSKQNDQSIVINALLIFDVDASLKKDVEAAYLLARNELPAIIDYLSKHCAGFENASLDQVARTLYIREGIRIIGQETLTANDVFEHTDFPNTIAYGSYPMDLQASKKGDYGSALCGRCLYSIPLGCMLPKEFNNILILGRSASFDILAHGSARTIPVLMSMAENATVAMDYSIKNNISVRELNSSYHHLAKCYKYIYNFNGFHKRDLPKEDFYTVWYYPYIHHLRSKGFFSLGYKPYALDSQTNTKKSLVTTITLLANHSDFKLSQTAKTFIHGLNSEISVQDICLLSSYLLNVEVNTLEDLLNQKIIDHTTYLHIQQKTFLSHGEVYALLDGLIKKINPYVPSIRYQDSIDVIAE